MSADGPSRDGGAETERSTRPASPRRGRWTAGAVTAIVIGVLAALAGAGGDDDEVPIPATTVPPSTTTTVGPWQAADFAGLPRVYSEIVPVGGQLVAYHTVEPDGSVQVVVVDLAEARVNWRRRVEIPPRVRSLPLPPPAYQADQNLIHVIVDETFRAPDEPLPGEEEPTATPEPTQDPDVEPALVLVGIDASDGFGITEVPLDVVPIELPTMCGGWVCIDVNENGRKDLARIDPVAGTGEVIADGLFRTVAVAGAEAVSMGDTVTDGYTGPVMATADFGSTVTWESTVTEVFGRDDVSPARARRGTRGADGTWALWVAARRPTDPPAGESFVPYGEGESHPPGAVAIVDADGSTRGVVDGSLCRSLLVEADERLSTVAVCDGGWSIVGGRRVAPTTTLRLVDLATGAVVTEIPTAPFDDLSPGARVLLVEEGVFSVDVGGRRIVVDLFAGEVRDEQPGRLEWCVAGDEADAVVRVTSADGARREHRVAPAVYPCTAALGEIPAGAVGAQLEAGELDPDGVGFVRTASWVTWIGPDRQLRAVRLG